MKVTSHFIGIKINSRIFVNLFIILQQYLKEQDIEQIVELQDIHSLHISLYYLEKNILPEKQNLIKDITLTLNQEYKNFVLNHKEIDYFSRNSEDYLGFASCTPLQDLEKINKQLVNKLKSNQVLDNKLLYVPHISLFKILNNNIFKKHKNIINQLINRELNKTKNENLFQKFSLFEVNSHFHPEIQFIVNAF